MSTKSVKLRILIVAFTAASPACGGDDTGDASVDAALDADTGGNDSGAGDAGEFTGTVLFSCDWPNVGNDAADCGEGNPRFSAEVETADSAASVVDATDFGLSANWPNDRAFLVRCQDRSGGCARQVVRNLEQWPLPTAGDVLAFRITKTVATEVLGSDSGNWNEHGFKTSPAGGSNASTFMLTTQAHTDGTWGGNTRALVGASWPNDAWCIKEAGAEGGCNNGPPPVALEGYAAYEFHFKYTFPTDTSYIVDARVYDVETGAMMSWTWQNINGSDSLPSPEFEVDVAGGANWNWDQVTLGHSATGEPDWSSGEGRPMMFFGGYAVCEGDWCPRYGELPGEN